ncbi:WecB/TagA/CpsF family glycosyltransferase [Haloimpatiens lingqiaonensis]|uniref:WecB/TagA/CpsF family glycosyltransferase n=1 Tax=Haloimpatiens lingqiaonensis TaxID=1380675 RepID=UPI0010FF26A0|nr:WecB/TagA/CpsF family glycosyltransferase [Haloimpatiens lingqiaonensis]
MASRILKFDVYDKSKKDLINEIDKYNKVHIISGNPEVLTNGLNNEKLFKNFTSENSIIIPDGIGTIVSSKIVGQPVEEKIAGIELMDELLKKYEKEGKSVYLLGAVQSTLEECILKIKNKYPKINIAGSHNGFFKLNDCMDIVEDIKNSGAHALFVAMGCPRQEIFISDNMDKLPCKVYMGVGGSFDVFAGKVQRAPKWMINMGLEWLYRVSKEPYRIKRLGVIPKFIIKVIKEKNSIKNSI